MHKRVGNYKVFQSVRVDLRKHEVEVRDVSISYSHVQRTDLKLLGVEEI